jgi:hypothetical protein
MIPHLIQRLKSMPHWLRFIALCGAIFGPVGVLAPFLPGEWANEETGEAISNAEAWRSGLAIEVMLAGAFLMFASACVFRRISWIRYMIPLTFLSLAVYCYLNPDTSSQVDMYGALVWAVLSGWYFLLKPNVREYFKKETEQV